MSESPGKYDALCTYVREQSQALGVIVVVFGGNQGSGFSVQAPPELSLDLPTILENLAENIRAEIKQKLT
jgi:hypothetical protein